MVMKLFDAFVVFVISFELCVAQKLGILWEFVFSGQLLELFMSQKLILYRIDCED